MARLRLELSITKSGLKAALFENKPDIPFHRFLRAPPQRGARARTGQFCAGEAIYAYFCAFGNIARIFPLHLPGGLERRRFWGGVSALEGHLPVLEGSRGAWRRELLVALKRSVAALGRPLA